MVTERSEAASSSPAPSVMLLLIVGVPDEAISTMAGLEPFTVLVSPFEAFAVSRIGCPTHPADAEALRVTWGLRTIRLEVAVAEHPLASEAVTVYVVLAVTL